MDKVMHITDPLVIIYRDDGKLKTVLNTSETDYREFGILIADLVRHVANAYNVTEGEVFEWVEKEMYNPTSPVIEIKPN